ncbi:nickel pincer cofactor biosynthesis protein LarC [Negativibacillus massiliensis]|uniref:LarC family nickel insertion protein n=2 Tax=Negativibacillus massiliensis TaxID=1871035 RepID=UPI000975EF13|nr:LarC family nickel insertion protein [Negativibacillus massiliensis]
MPNKLYLECYSGISGDMTVAALLDLGADQQVLLEGLESLNLPGYQLKIGRVKKNGIDACDFDVILDEPEHHHDHDHEHHHDHDHEHHHDHEHDHEHEHHHDHDHEHHHDHDHEHHHDHDHEHHHHHDHVHRNIGDIFAIIDQSKISDRAKQTAKDIFRIIAAAESKAHGIAEDQVHFHEVGAVDSIVDIVSAAICLDNLDITEAVVSDLYEGCGYVHCQHGLMPVPVPAVVNIAADNALRLRLTQTRGEMITPTGAAIAAYLSKGGKLPESFVIEKIGLGAGKKDFATANILRAFLIRD